MNKIELMLLMTVVCMIALIVLLIVRFNCLYGKQVKHIRYQLGVCTNWNEYATLKSELNALYCCIVPGIGVKGMKKIFSIFNDSDGLITLLLPSVTSIVVCMFLLASGTYAWFTANQSVSIGTIQTASFNVECVVTDDKIKDNYYQVTLTKTGNASDGYCKIQYENNTWYLKRADFTSDKITFYIVDDIKPTVTVVSSWGNSNSITSTDLIGKYWYGNNFVEKVESNTESINEEENQSTENTHTIQEGETLQSILAFYSVSEDQLKESNPDIDWEYLEVGTNIVIPSEKIDEPSEETEQSTVEYDKYMIVEGDTIESVVSKLNITVEELLTINSNLTVDGELTAGMEINIPKNIEMISETSINSETQNELEKAVDIATSEESSTSSQNNIEDENQETDEDETLIQ